jgi:Gas vesicle synthesis protein GvpL/GvpF
MAARVDKTPNTAIYLYGVTAKEASLGKLLGVDGLNVVESLPCAGLFCWISRVSRKEFAGNLSSNMENLDWLAEASVQHQRVVSAIAHLNDILPARFGTVFLSETSLKADIRAKKSTLQKDFSKIHDADEFGVKVFGVLPNVELPKISARTGKDYLKAKAALMQRRPAKKPNLNSDFREFQDELEHVAIEMAQAGKISGGQRGLQWQISLLIRRGDRKKFDAILREYSRQWAGAKQIECTGPWPPYSFVSRGERG